MALLVTESFDGTTAIAHLISTDTTMKWITLNVAPLSLVSGYTSNALRYTFPAAGTAQNWVIIRELSSPGTGPFHVGLWYRQSALSINTTGPVGSGTTAIPIALSAATYTAGSTTAYRPGVGVCIDGSGKAHLYRWSASSALTVLASSTGQVIFANTWQYIELKASWSATAACSIRVDEIEVVSGTYDTKAADTEANLRNVLPMFVPGGSSSIQITSDIDDVYVCDGVGARNNDLLGVVAVTVSRPDGQGTYSEWGNSGATDPVTTNYSYIDEAAVSDTDFIESADIGSFDTHTYADVSITQPLVAGVCHNVRAASTGSSRSLQILNLLDPDLVTSSDVALDGFLRHKEAINEAAPDGSDWTPALVNDAEWGYEVT